MTWKRNYSYISKAKADRNFWLHEIRKMPDFIPSPLMKQLITIEEAYRRNRIDRLRVNAIGMLFKKKYNIWFRIADENNMIFLAPSANYLIDCFAAYPNIMSIIGDRYAGKTVTAWSIALDMLEKMENARLYVYGDVDGIGDVLKQKNDSIVVKKDYSIPPPSDAPKIIIYNELSRQLLSKYARTTENVEINLQAFRARHRNAWIIYNIARHGSLERVLRDTSSIFLFKWLTGLNLQNAMELIPYGWRDIIKIAAHFGHEQGLAIVPKINHGVEFFIHLTKPQKELLKAIKKAKKNKLMMMSENEKSRKIFEVISQIYDDVGKIPTSGQLHDELMLKYSMQYSKRQLRNYINRWKLALGVKNG